MLCQVHLLGDTLYIAIATLDLASGSLWYHTVRLSLDLKGTSHWTNSYACVHFMNSLLVWGIFNLVSKKGNCSS